MPRTSTLDKKLKILFVSSEVAPLSKVGGLGDVLWALPSELKKLGYDVRIFTPKYGVIKEERFKTKYYKNTWTKTLESRYPTSCST